MIIGDMTAVNYELNYNCLSQLIVRSGLQDVLCHQLFSRQNPSQADIGTFQWHIYH